MTTTTGGGKPHTIAELDRFVKAFALVEEYPDFVRFFDELGIPTLRATLDQPGGVLAVMEAEDAEKYCGFAAKIEEDADCMTDSFVHFVSFLADCLLNTLCTDSEAYHHDPETGRAFLHFEGHPPYEITAVSMRHWQWMVALLSIVELPTRLLDSVPPAMRDRAREEARATKQKRRDGVAFLEIMQDVDLEGGGA